MKRPLVTGVFYLSTDNLILRSYELGGRATIGQQCILFKVDIDQLQEGKICVISACVQIYFKSCYYNLKYLSLFEQGK